MILSVTKLKTQGYSLAAEEWLAEFMAGYGERIRQKSAVHRRILKRILRMT